MVVYRKGTKIITKDGNRIQAILEIDFQDGLIIYAFPGSLSPNDVLVKFIDSNILKSKIRQPKHIHWAMDLSIKKDNMPELTDQFLQSMLNRWSEIEPLENREYQTIFDNLTISKDKDFITKFNNLNQHGFFSMEFITHLMEILMIQEKTNRPDAYMFKNVVNKILEYKDLYAIVSKATHTGRK